MEYEVERVLLIISGALPGAVNDMFTVVSSTCIACCYYMTLYTTMHG